MKQTVRERMPQIRPRLRQKDIFNVSGHRFREDTVKVGAHLLEERRYGSVLLCLGGVIEYGHVVAMCLQYMAQGIFQERSKNVGCADKVAPEELRETSRERLQQISRHEWAVLEQRSEHVVRKVVLVHYGPASGIDLPECDQPAPDSFGLRDLRSDRGIAPCLAKESAVRAVDHLPFSIKMRCPDEGAEGMLSNTCHRFAFQISGIGRVSKSRKHEQLVEQAVFLDFFFDVFDNLSQIHFL